VRENKKKGGKKGRGEGAIYIASYATVNDERKLAVVQPRLHSVHWSPLD